MGNDELATVALLIDMGADLDIEDCNGDKAIELARQNGDEDMMDLLKKAAK